MVLHEVLPDFGLDNLLNKGISQSYGTVIGLGDSLEKIIKRKYLFLLTNNFWKMFYENYGKS